MISLIPDLIFRQSLRAPDRIAMEFGEQSLTYSELNRRSNQLARHLQACGIGPESVVGLCMERSIELLIGVVGVLKAGAAYLPLDPQYPAERLDFMASDSGIAMSLTQDTVRESAFRNDAPVTSAATAESLAYILYTSGSTGKPKGVEVTHANVINFLFSLQDILGFSERETLLSVTGLTFDIAGLDLYLTWMTGARLVLVPRSTVLDGKALSEALDRSGATVLQTTPVTWRMLLDAGWRAPRGFKALCGGEAMPPSLFRDLTSQKAHLWNLYGPTETTIWSTAREMTDADGNPLVDRITVGKPIAHTTVHVLDASAREVASGETGELYIGGKGVARGYRNRADLTAERFLPNPFCTGGRYYRTGDRARMLPNGELEILGRADHQIKWHGYRIEPGEIEEALRSAASVKDCVVVLRDDGAEARIVGYLVSRTPLDLEAVLARLQPCLPAYMIPGALVVLPSFPTNSNGKLDRNRLPPVS